MFASVSADAAESLDELELYMREMSRSERQSREQACPSHICTGTGLTPPTSAPGLGSPLQTPQRARLQQAHHCHVSNLTVIARTARS